MTAEQLHSDLKCHNCGFIAPSWYFGKLGDEDWCEDCIDTQHDALNASLREFKQIDAQAGDVPGDLVQQINEQAEPFAAMLYAWLYVQLITRRPIDHAD
jgi:hypothetical protein